MMTRGVHFALLLGLIVPSSACASFVSFDDYSPEPRPTQFYSIRGRIEGLGRYVVHLRMNGIERLATDGKFAFEAAVADGSPFAIAVEAAVHDCDIRGGTGTVRGADVEDVLITCRMR